jgi:hypothetical protein
VPPRPYVLLSCATSADGYLDDASPERLILSGPADDFQRGELVQILDDIPGVVDVQWDPGSLPQEQKVRS